MSDAVKNLRIGDILQLQHAPPTDIHDRYAVRLVGYLPGHSIVITRPRRNGSAVLVREGQEYTVRLLQGSNIFGFIATVLCVTSRPYPHLHLSYPQTVESAEVRNAPRVSTNLSALVYNASAQEEQRDNKQATIIDVSSTGGRLLLAERLGSVDDLIQLSFSLEICGGVDKLQLLGTIRNAQEPQVDDSDPESRYGVQFTGLTRFQQLLLCSYVCGHKASDRG